MKKHNIKAKKPLIKNQTVTQIIFWFARKGQAVTSSCRSQATKSEEIRSE